MRSTIANAIQEAEKLLDFSTLLHPVNATEQKQKFLSGEIEEPMFTYANVEIPNIAFPTYEEEGEIPDLYRDRMQQVSLLADLLHACGDDENFSALSLQAFPLKEITLPEDKSPRKPTVGEESLDAATIALRFEEALKQCDCNEWNVEIRDNISARLMVDQWNSVLVVREGVSLNEAQLQGLIRHEVGVHVLRVHNGRKQSEPLLHVGTARGRLIEEGVAITRECENEPLNPRIVMRHKAVMFAQSHSFRETWQMLRDEGYIEEVAWQYALRIKRGLANGSSSGGFTRDAIYAQAYEEMQSYVSSIDMNALLSAPIHPDEIDIFDLQIFKS